MDGDSALIDDDGFLHILGRHKDDINVNGVKHPSVDIERCIADSVLRVSRIHLHTVRLKKANTKIYTVFYRHANVDVKKITRDQRMPKKKFWLQIQGIKNVSSA